MEGFPAAYCRVLALDIDGDDGLQMVYNQQWILGQFEGATFHGHVTFWGRQGPGCTYLLNLERTSA